MMGLLKASADLVPIHEDENVMKANAALQAALADEQQWQSVEQRFVRIVTGKESNVTDADIDEAHQRLAIVKGTQSAWFLPEAEAAREQVKRARRAHQAAVSPAQERLTNAGTEQLRQLTVALDAALAKPRKLAQDIDQLLKQVSDGGGKLPDHPCRCLMPGELADLQLRNARSRGWI